MEKNIILASAALALIGTLPLPVKNVTPVSTPPVPIVMSTPVPVPTPCPIEGFLARIAHLESSNGKNTNHKPVTWGIHNGTAAVGKYGLMPLTVKEVAKKSKNPLLKPLAKLPPAQVATALSENEEIAKKVARKYARRLYHRFDGDMERMAFGWRMGPNRKFNPEHPYVLAFAKVETE